jgi:hypothetical protein
VEEAAMEVIESTAMRPEVLMDLYKSAGMGTFSSMNCRPIFSFSAWSVLD